MPRFSSVVKLVIGFVLFVIGMLITGYFQSVGV